MKRKIISLLLALIIAFGTMPLSTVFAVDTTSVVVTADKTSAYPGDTVLFTVSVGAVNHLMGAEFVLSIPSGMTYTLNSAAVAEGLAGKVGFASADWTESTMKFTAYGDGDYSSADLTDFLTFSCKIDDNTLGEITPQITDVVLSDTNFEEISTSVNTDGAVVTVSEPPVSVTGVTLNKNTLSLYTGDSETLIANLIPANSANKTVSWKSDDTSVATVDDNGKVTAIKKGSTTVTVTTADGGFTDTCTVDVACSHSNKTVHPAVASTCLVEGNEQYTTCDDCGEVISGSSIKLPLGNHNFTESVQSKYLLSAAQCNKKAVYYKSCSVCGVASTTDTFEYGEFDLNNHIGTTYIKNQKEATCYEEGYTGDIYCLGCNSKLSSGTVIGKNAHNPASVWSTDENYHWHNCQTVGCGNLIDKAVHIGGEATCINKAICSVCNVEYGVLDTNNHKNTKVINAKAATCCENGYTGDTYCNDCNTIISSGTVILASGKHIDADGKWETNGTNHWHTCYYGTKFDLTAHSGGTATCKDKAVCSVCGTSYGELDASNHAGGTEIRDKVSNTCCEDGYAGDTYCLGCNTKILNGTVILASGNHTDTDGKWETDGTNHWHTCYYGTKFDLTAHSGGTATCKDKAVCLVCGVAYGELDAHNHTGTTYKKNQKEATCYEEGYTGDTYCSDCNAKLSSGSVIEKNSHNPASTWSTDADFHWHDCQTVGCGNLIDKAAHTGGEATCIHKAVCSVCNVEYGSLDSNNHKNTEIRNAKAATCCEDGYTGDTYCKDCNKKIASGTTIPATGNHIDADGLWETDGTAHWHTCSYGTKFDVTSHSGGTATCKDKSVCSVCGSSYGEVDLNNHIGATYIKDQKEASCYEEGYTGDTYCSGCNSKLVSGTVIEKNAHNPASVWSTDENYHWHACQTVGCGNQIQKSSHTGGIATCINKAVCSVCAAEYGSKDPNNHTGNTEIRNISEPKCNAEGYTGDTYCKDCSVKILSGKSIPKLSHSITEWTVTKTATTTETGEKTGRCVLCGEVFKAEIARLTSKPVESTNIEYSGMETAPQIVPDGNTVLPENVIFIANRLSPENFTAKQSELAKNVINQVINNASAVLGSGKKANGAQVICAFDISSKIQNYDTVSGDKLGDEDYKVDGYVNVTVQAPQMKNLKNPYLVYVKNDGSYEAVKFTDNGDGTISFIATGSEHNYLLLDIDVFKTDEKRTDGTKSPNMADDEGSCALPIIMFALSVTGLAVLIIDKKKRIK